jgi:hypothetical protein
MLKRSLFTLVAILAIASFAYADQNGTPNANASSTAVAATTAAKDKKVNKVKKTVTPKKKKEDAPKKA